MKLSQDVRLLARLVVPIFVAGDEAIDDEIQFHRDGKDTGVSVQISRLGGTFYYTACRWNEAEGTMTFGKETRRIEVATAEAMEWLDQRAEK